jgi:hypothetical protein
MPVTGSFAPEADNRDGWKNDVCFLFRSGHRPRG